MRTLLACFFLLSSALLPALAAETTSAAVPATPPMTPWIQLASGNCSQSNNCCCKLRKPKVTVCFLRTKCATRGGSCQATTDC